MDWADKLVEKAKNRGEEVCAEYLRDTITRLCQSNMERWERSGESPIEDHEKREKEEKERLIKLREEEDDKEQLKFDFKKEKGISIIPDHQPGKIAEVELDFTSEEWADLLNREGELLHSCCADISRIRDILQDACRNDYCISVEDLFEAACLAENHGFKANEDHPIGRIILLWEKVKDHARQRFSTFTANLENPKDALEMLFQAAGVITWEELVHKDEVMFESKVCRNAALATIQSAVRVLSLKLKEMNEGPVEGYGIVQQNNEIAHTARGLAVFETPEIAQKICEKWNSIEEENDNMKTKNTYSVKKVKISMEKGLEFINNE